MIDWQPIDTAPVDGTSILLNAPDWPEPQVGHYESFVYTIAATRRETGRHAGWSIPNPTHWRPL